MKKREPQGRKLRLWRETLHRLTREELERVVAGDGDSNPPTVQPTTTTTVKELPPPGLG